MKSDTKKIYDIDYSHNSNELICKETPYLFEKQKNKSSDGFILSRKSIYIT